MDFEIILEDDDYNDGRHLATQCFAKLMGQDGVIIIIIIIACSALLFGTWAWHRVAFGPIYNNTQHVGAQDIVTNLKRQLPDQVTLNDGHTTAVAMHCALTVDVVKQYCDLSKICGVLTRNGCTLAGMAATDYPNYRNLSVRIPLEGHEVHTPLLKRWAMVGVCFTAACACNAAWLYAACLVV